ncbi:MAG: c-type cytochrome [Gammaproteobacteria bacterium]|nr:c-type cytochrome [Gammaproteobacteria bacterium]
MRNIILASLLITISQVALANDGETIYKDICSECHVMQMGWEIKDKTTLKAPPFPGVTNLIRKIYNNESQFVEFVSNYIQNPTRIRSRTKEAVIDRFGLMPNIGANMSKEDRETVAKWMFNNVGLN